MASLALECRRELRVIPEARNANATKISGLGCRV